MPEPIEVFEYGCFNCCKPITVGQLAEHRCEQPEQSPRTIPDNSPTSSDTPDNSLRDQLQAAIESEVYEFRERTMWWPEGEITAEIARLATRGAMEALTGGQASAHVYLSTGCLHGDHAYCQSMTGLNGAKRPASCKKCGAGCICSCHKEQPDA